jgi:hypothetical protein
MRKGNLRSPGLSAVAAPSCGPAGPPGPACLLLPSDRPSSELSHPREVRQSRWVFRQAVMSVWCRRRIAPPPGGFKGYPPSACLYGRKGQGRPCHTHLGVRQRGGRSRCDRCSHPPTHVKVVRAAGRAEYGQGEHLQPPDPDVTDGISPGHRLTVRDVSG